MLDVKTSLIDKGVKPGYDVQRNGRKIDVGHNSIGDIVSIELEPDNGQANVGLVDNKAEWYTVDSEAQLLSELNGAIGNDSNKEELQKLVSEALAESSIDGADKFLVRVATRTNSIQLPS